MLHHSLVLFLTTVIYSSTAQSKEEMAGGDNKNKNESVQ